MGHLHVNTIIRRGLEALAATKRSRGEITDSNMKDADSIRKDISIGVTLTCAQR